MKKILFILILLNFKAFSQNFTAIDDKVKNYKFIRSAEQLAQKIDLDFNSDIEKIRAIYTWITLNIKYYNPKTNTFLLKEPQTIVYYDEDDLKTRLKLIDDGFNCEQKTNLHCVIKQLLIKLNIAISQLSFPAIESRSSIHIKSNSSNESKKSDP